MPATTFGFAHEQALRGRRIPLLGVDEDIGNTAGQRGPHRAYRGYPARLRFWGSFDGACDLLFDHDVVHWMPSRAATRSCEHAVVGAGQQVAVRSLPQHEHVAAVQPHAVLLPTGATIVRNEDAAELLIV